MNSEKTILQDAVADLFPGTFALVMATGIISIAADLLRWPILPRLFFLLNIFFYAALWVLFVIRGIFFAPRLRADFSNPVRGVGFFTVVAATCILGSEAFLIACDYGWSFALLVLGGILWAVLTYGLFAALVTAKEKPAFTASIHGSWLIAVVAAQSVSVLAGLNAGRTNSEALLLFSVLLFLAGAFLYLVLITLIFHRLFFFPVEPRDLVPSYWINMGAAAITTLAGAGLLLHGPSPPAAVLLPFIGGFTVFFWAAATWWIPLLAVLWVWRHGFRGMAITYHPQYWSVVFPLGMYTACTFQLSRVPGLGILSPIPHYFIYVALAAWALTFFGMLRSVGRILRKAM